MIPKLQSVLTNTKGPLLKTMGLLCNNDLVKLEENTTKQMFALIVMHSLENIF
jgi:hypothetical protein